MNIKLRKIQPQEIGLFRQEMKRAFEQGVMDRFCCVAGNRKPLPGCRTPGNLHAIF